MNPAADFLQLIEIHPTYRQNFTKITGSNVNKFQNPFLLKMKIQF